jgi:hypothetical protein
MRMIRTALLGVVALMLFLSVAGLLMAQTKPKTAAPAAKPPEAPGGIPAGHLPDQAHAMVDVAQHFQFVWLSAHESNWALAKFMAHETVSHLRWSVRLKPIRKNAKGEEVSLEAVLEKMEKGSMAKVEAAIAAKSWKNFFPAYREAVKACNDCHEQTEKGFIQVKVPKQVGDYLQMEPKKAPAAE